MLEKSTRRRNIFPFMKTVDDMLYELDTRESIPAFHALTGSNTASYIAGNSKKCAWMTFQLYCHLGKPRKD